MDLAADVAWTMATWPSSTNIDQWIDHAQLGQLLGAVPANYLGHSKAEWYNGVQELYAVDGLLIPQAGLKKDVEGYREVRWLHRTLQEHLAAGYLTRIIKADARIGLVKLRHFTLRPAWDETLNHAAGLIADAHLSNTVIDDLWDWRSHGDTPRRHIQAQIILIAAHSGDETQLKEMSALFSRQCGGTFGIGGFIYADSKLSPNAVDSYFGGIDLPREPDEIWHLVQRIDHVLSKRSSPRALGVLRSLSPTSWLAQECLWKHAYGSTLDLNYLRSGLPPRSSLPADLEPRSMAEICIALLRVHRGQVLAGNSAQGVLASGHPLAEEMLRVELAGGGIEARLLEDIAYHPSSSEVPFINSLDSHEALNFCQPGSPSFLAYLVAATWDDAGILVEASKLNPWVAAGMASRWAAFPENPDEMIWDGWSVGRAEQAIDCLRDRRPPTAVQMGEFWNAARYLLEKGIPTRITSLIDFYHLNDNSVWPLFWWSNTAFPLRDALSRSSTWEEILEQIEESEVFDDYGADSFVREAINKLPEQERTAAVISYVRRRRHRNWTVRGYDLPHVDGISSDLMRIAHGLPPASARALMLEVELLLSQDDRLWEFFDDVLRLFHATPLAYVPGRYLQEWD